MWTIAVLSGLFICVFCSKFKHECVYPERMGSLGAYYWREYWGVVPKDAVPGGYSKDGNITYVAQVPSRLLILLAGNIYPGQKEAMACPVTKLVEGLYVKILCCNPETKLDWVAITADEIHMLTDYHWVIGGAEDCVYPGKIGNQPDYYWRDFFGVIPKDAVPGGYSKDGNVTYIGQLPSASLVGIFPGTLHPGKPEATSSQGKTVVTSFYVKILCSNSPRLYEWVKTTADEIHLLTDYHWVLGGGEGTTLSYVGRVRFDGEVQIGRVYHRQGGQSVIIIYNDAGTDISFRSFELLVLPR